MTPTATTPTPAAKAAEKAVEKTEKELAKVEVVERNLRLNPPIGKVEDVLTTKGTSKLKTPEENQKGDVMPDDKKAELQPITSLAQLRDHRIKYGTPPGRLADQQREEVKKLEEEILKEGADKVRGSAESGEGR